MEGHVCPFKTTPPAPPWVPGGLRCRASKVEILVFFRKSPNWATLQRPRGLAPAREKMPPSLPCKLLFTELKNSVSFPVKSPSPRASGARRIRRLCSRPSASHPQRKDAPEPPLQAPFYRTRIFRLLPGQKFLSPSPGARPALPSPARSHALPPAPPDLATPAPKVTPLF